MKTPDQVINTSEIQGPRTKTDDYSVNYAKDEGVVADEWLMFCKQNQEDVFKDETSPENQRCSLLQTDIQIYYTVTNCCIFTVDLQQYPTVFYNNCKILLNIHPSHVN